MGDERKRIAVIGGGISGISCAYRLDREFAVTIFEKNHYLGGHTNTVTIPSGPDEGLCVDTGFIVLNNKNYPRLHQFFGELGVEVRDSDMSFGFVCEKTGFAYAGTDLNGLFAQRRNAFRLPFWKLLWGIFQFCRKGGQALREKDLRNESLEGFLSRINVPAEAIRDYILPMGAAIWSIPSSQVLEFPAASFLRFFENHGLLGIKDRPVWQTVIGGSHAYVKKFQQTFSGDIILDAGVTAVSRDGQIIVRRKSGDQSPFDAVVFAAHADETLRLLEKPTAEEQRLLGPWRYQINKTVLHTDESVLPQNRRAWASWNYAREDLPQKGGAAAEEAGVSVTYDMNRLQGLKSASQYCVSLNRAGAIDPQKVVAGFNYTHPVYNLDSIGTQSQLQSLQGGNQSYFCGSYFGYGFHEDGIASGEEAARALQAWAHER